MPKTAKKLSAKAVSELKWNPKRVDTKGRPYPSMLPVGPTNLYLQATHTGSKVSIFVFGQQTQDLPQAVMSIKQQREAQP
ncbi:MAG: hypothetical protein CMP84_05180 [Gammaproteobacteria bacterium]|nr:hypothetical protein [Gammaproteobacteria bacterium]